MLDNQGAKSALCLVLVAALATVSSSCASGEPQAIEITRIVPETVEVTRVVPQTVVATRLVQVVVTATPEPPTPTLEPTPTSAFQKWTSSQAIEAFKAAGLEAEDTHPMTKDDYGMAPMVAVEGIRFLIPSLCDDCGGRVLSFDSPDDLEKTKAFYVTLGEESAWLFSWVFTRDNILVQINGDLPQERALEYEAALESLE